MINDPVRNEQNPQRSMHEKNSGNHPFLTSQWAHTQYQIVDKTSRQMLAESAVFCYPTNRVKGPTKHQEAKIKCFRWRLQTQG